MRISIRVWAALTVFASLLIFFPTGVGLTIAAGTGPGLVPHAPAFGTAPPDNAAILAGALPEFPTNLTHFVYIIRENHAFDDYLGDCHTTINSTCDNSTDYYLSPNHINDTPFLHYWAQQGTTFDNMYTSEDPFSAQAHSFLFSADVSTASGTDNCGSSTIQGMGSGTQWYDYNYSTVRAGSCSWSPDGSQQYPSGGTVFDRLTRSNVPQVSAPEPFVVIGDVIWELSSPKCSVSSSSGIPGSLPGNSIAVEHATCTGTQGWWKNTTSGSINPIPPVTNPTTHIPEELFVCQYACSTLSPMNDQYAAYAFISYVKDYGLPTYTWIELFDDHPGPQCTSSNYDTCIQWNDQSMNLITQDIFNASSPYRNNTVVAITEDETQDGANGPDHENSGRRLPFVLVASPNVMKTGSSNPASCGISSGKCGNIDHETFNTSNVLAVMERVELNVNHGIWSTTAGGLTTFPMALNDQLASVNPLENVWRCSDPRVPCNTGTFATQVLTSTTIAPNPATVATSGTTTLTATALDQTGSTISGATFAWSTPTLGSVSPSTGTSVTYTAPATAGAGHVCENATYNSVTVQGCGLITVTSTIVLSSVSVTPGPAASALVGSTVNFSGLATTNVGYVYPHTPATFSWSASNAINGVLNATTGTTQVSMTVGLQWGNVTICLNVTYNSKTLGSCTWLEVTKASPTLTSATITPTGAAVQVGGSQLFTAQAYDQYLHPMYGSGVTYSWSLQTASLGSLNQSVGKGYDTFTGFTAGSSAGFENVTVSVSNGPQAVQVVSAEIRISLTPPPLTVSFTESVSSGPAPLLVTFQGTVTGGSGTGYADTWNFGDGSPTEAQSGAAPAYTYTYPTAGSFTPTLSVQDSAGHSASFSGPVITVTGGSTPLTALASGTPLDGAVPLTVSLSASASGGTAPYTYAWNLGDGTTSTLQDPAHTYTIAGTYTATLFVNDSAGHEASATVEVQATAGTAGTLTIAPVASPSTGAAPLLVNFAVAASGGTAPYTYAWSFGDGSAEAFGATTSHTYAAAGTYGVVVTATDADGRTAQGVLTIVVSPSSPPPSGTGLGPLGLSWTDWGLLLVILALIVILAVVLASRRPPRKTPGGGEDSGGWEDQGAWPQASYPASVASGPPQPAPQASSAPSTPAKAPPTSAPSNDTVAPSPFGGRPPIVRK